MTYCQNYVVSLQNYRIKIDLKKLTGKKREYENSTKN